MSTCRGKAVFEQRSPLLHLTRGQFCWINLRISTRWWHCKWFFKQAPLPSDAMFWPFDSLYLTKMSRRFCLNQVLSMKHSPCPPELHKRNPWVKFGARRHRKRAYFLSRRGFLKETGRKHCKLSKSLQYHSKIYAAAGNDSKRVWKFFFHHISLQNISNQAKIVKNVSTSPTDPNQRIWLDHADIMSDCIRNLLKYLLWIESRVNPLVIFGESSEEPSYLKNRLWRTVFKNRLSKNRLLFSEPSLRIESSFVFQSKEPYLKNRLWRIVIEEPSLKNRL